MNPTHMEGMGFLGTVGTVIAGTYSIVGEIHTAIVLMVVSIALMVADWHYR